MSVIRYTKQMNSVYGFTRHPGRILGRELQARGMTPADLAASIGLTEHAMTRIIDGLAPISPEISAHLERVLGTPAYMWSILQENYEKTANEIGGEHIRESD